MSTCGSTSAQEPTHAIGATFKIWNKDSAGTCFLVSQDATSRDKHREYILITANHALEKMSGDVCRLIMRTRTDSGYKREEVGLPIRSNGKQLWHRHPTADVAAFKVSLSDRFAITPIKMNQILKTESAATLNTADKVWVPGYPAKLEANQYGFPVLRSGTVASFPVSMADKTWLLAANTFAGDSGAPVIKNAGEKPDPLTLVGIVIGMHRETTKTVSQIEERTVHRPLGLAIVVHSNTIRQTIELVN